MSHPVLKSWCEIETVNAVMQIEGGGSHPKMKFGAKTRPLIL